MHCIEGLYSHIGSSIDLLLRFHILLMFNLGIKHLLNYGVAFACLLRTLLNKHFSKLTMLLWWLRFSTWHCLFVNCEDIEYFTNSSLYGIQWYTNGLIHCISQVTCFQCVKGCVLGRA